MTNEQRPAGGTDFRPWRTPETREWVVLTPWVLSTEDPSGLWYRHHIPCASGEAAEWLAKQLNEPASAPENGSGESVPMSVDDAEALLRMLPAARALRIELNGATLTLERAVLVWLLEAARAAARVAAAVVDDGCEPVRVAVAVDEQGNWSAWGVKTSGANADAKAAGEARDMVPGENVRISFITDRVPRPEPQGDQEQQ